MAVRIFSWMPEGFEGRLVEIEVIIRRGIPAVDVIGLAGSAVRESRDRIRCACQGSGYVFPRDRVLVNLSPAGLAKQGTSFDLAIALGILQASGQWSDAGMDSVLVLGELCLSGRLSPVHGVLAALLCGLDHGITHAMVPVDNRSEAGSCREMEVRVLTCLADLAGPDRVWESHGTDIGARSIQGPATRAAWKCRDFAGGYFNGIRNQDDFRLALVIAAAGAHHGLVFGPPGAGKTMGMHALRELWPPLDVRSLREVRHIRSLAGADDEEGDEAPFRMPHHSASMQALLGGGKPVRPGEVSLAHRGILVLDEAPEFQSRVLQGLREPLESGHIAVSRAGTSVWFPAAATVFLSMNPCPCGNLGKPGAFCTCGNQEVSRYWSRLGGPLLDRLDIRMGLYADACSLARELGIPLDLGGASGRIAQARAMQEARWGGECLNGQVSDGSATLLQGADKGMEEDLSGMAEAEGWSRRGMMGALRLARTIADLCGCETLVLEHLEAARKLRSMARFLPGLIPE